MEMCGVKPWQFLSTTSDCQLIRRLHLSLTLFNSLLQSGTVNTRKYVLTHQTISWFVSLWCLMGYGVSFRAIGVSFDKSYVGPFSTLVWRSLLTSREAFSVNIKYLNMNDHSIIALYPTSIFNIKWSFSKIFLPIYNWHNATAISYFQNSKHSNHRVLKLDHLL